MLNRPKQFDTVLYHDPCMDGFCAAWIAHSVLGDSAKYIPMKYGRLPSLETVKGKRVLIVDFSLPRDDLLLVKDTAAELVVLDHHATAQKDLEGLDFCEFDMERSGAMMAWDYFYPQFHQGPPTGRSRPWLVDYVQDRDLWRFKLPESRAINASIQSWPKTFAFWDDQQDYGAEGKGIRAHIDAGKAILRFTDECIAELIRDYARVVTFEGHEIYAVNVYNKLASETLSQLARLKPPFALGWAQTKSGDYLYSLRAVPEFDCSGIAKKFGGGGHPQASGFSQGKLIV